MPHIKNLFDDSPTRSTRMVAFLACARIGRPIFNDTFTEMKLPLSCGKKRIRIGVHISEADRFGQFDTGFWKDDLFKKLFALFGLAAEHRQLMIGPLRFASCRLIEDELGKRGASISRIDGRIEKILKSGIPQKKQRARRCRGELNRALSCLRKARKLGATTRQMNKLIKRILGEEAVQEVQDG